MRVAILGYAGSGKSYVTEYISKKKDLPALHLDAVKFDKEWKPIDDELVIPQVFEFMEKDNWVIDGYYHYLLMEERLEKADMIVLLLLPRVTCFLGALKRTKSRANEGYKNDLNPWFIKFTLFGCRNKERRRSYKDIAKKYKSKTVVLRTRYKVNEFLKQF